MNDIPTRLETRARLRETARDTDCAGSPNNVYRNAVVYHTTDENLFHEFEEHEHEHEWFIQRVRLFAWLAAIGLVGAVAWMVG